MELLTLMGDVVIVIAIILLAASFCILVCGIALSPVIAVIYLIADLYERKTSSRNRSASQGETEASLK